MGQDKGSLIKQKERTCGSKVKRNIYSLLPVSMCCPTHSWEAGLQYTQRFGRQMAQ